ncbi:MAG: hypothetical protein KQH63_02695 [Desulfobulbaceae bacterium]|nr:hypothetical protein [Desulfobulbaceae bacterium]
MEPNTIFAASVGVIGAFHLIATAVSAVTRNRKAGETASRSDWYCFFKMSDLTGKDVNATTGEDARWNNTHEANIDQRRRQQAQRPRLHV